MKISVCILSLVMVICVDLQAENFKIGIAGSLQKIRSDGIGLENMDFSSDVYLDAARDESESFQLVIIADKGNSVRNLQVNCSSLKLGDNEVDIRWYKVGYVKTGNPSYAVEHIGMWPDILLPPQQINVAADMVQPLWFTVETTPQTPAGIYKGSIEISADGQVEIVNLTLRVRNFTIPRPGTLATPFGLYRWVLEEWYHGKRNTLNQEDYIKWSKFLAQYRLTPKEIGLEYVERKYETVDEKNRLTGVDMSALNPIVRELDEKYFAPYSMQLYRMQSGPTVAAGLEKNADWCTPENIAQPVRLFVEQWLKQGFSDKVYIYGIDEAHGEQMYNLLKETYTLIKQDLPTVKIMQTGLCNKPEMVGLIDIWCPKTDIAWDPFFQQRLADGDTLWIYTCVSPTPPHANFLVDQPAIDHRILFWQARELGATGFLYWTVLWHTGIEPKLHAADDAFPDSLWDYSQSNMFTDTWVHVNGDGVLVYPGKNLEPMPSIRLNVLRDGIEDYEYMAILESLIEEVEKLPKYQTAGTKPLINRARELSKVPGYISSGPTDFTRKPQDLLERRKAIADMIEQLTDILANKDYERWKM